MLKHPPEKAKIERLPKWAQSYIADLERQADDSSKALRSFLDNQTEGPCFTEKWVTSPTNTGPDRERYFFNAESDITIKRFGIQLNVAWHGLRGRHLELQWGEADKHSMCDVAMIPESFQRVRLVHHNHMRRDQ